MACIHVESSTNGGAVYTVTYVYTVSVECEAAFVTAMEAMRKATAKVAAFVDEIKEACSQEIEQTWVETEAHEPSEKPGRRHRLRPSQKPGSYG